MTDRPSCKYPNPTSLRKLRRETISGKISRVISFSRPFHLSLEKNFLATDTVDLESSLIVGSELKPKGIRPGNGNRTELATAFSLVPLQSLQISRRSSRHSNQVSSTAS